MPDDQCVKGVIGQHVLCVNTFYKKKTHIIYLSNIIELNYWKIRRILLRPH